MIICCLGSLTAQTTNVYDLSPEELEFELLNWSNKDTLWRISILNELAFTYFSIPAKKDSVLMWVTEAYDLAKVVDDTIGMGDALMRMGSLFDVSGNLEIAKEKYKKALFIREHLLKNAAGAASVCNNIALVYEKQRDSVNQALYYYRQGIQLLNGLEASTYVQKKKALQMNNLGHTLGTLGKFEEAQLFLDSSMLLRISVEDSVGLAHTKYNQGILFKRMGVPVQAKASYEIALDLYRLANDELGMAKSLAALGNHFTIVGRYDMAIVYLDSALQYLQNLPPEEAGRMLQDKAIIWQNLGQQQEARKYYQEALEYLTEAKDDKGLALVLLNLGILSFDKREYDESQYYLQKSLTYLSSQGEVTTQVEVYNYLAKSYNELGIPDSSVHYFNRYNTLKDSISQAYQATMNYKYDLALAEGELNKLTLEKEKQAKKQLQTYAIIGLVLGSLMIAILVLIYLFSRQKRVVAEQKVQLAQQELLDLIKKKDLERNYAWMDGLETARKEIGQELHDSVGSMLSIIKIYFSSVDEKLDVVQEENRRQHEKAYQLLDEVCDKIRQISHEMSSAVLVQFGLANQLETYAETLRELGQFRVELVVHGLSNRLETSIEFNIYRIIQELVNNVIKHAFAKQLSIQMNRFDEVINIMVEDDGCGFDVLEQEKKATGMGVNSVRSRLNELNGTIHIDSTPGNGTSISIDIPTSSI